MARMGTVPAPDTTRALLWCSTCGRPGRHDYAGGHPGDGVVVYQFACVRCGTQRVWGNLFTPAPLVVH